MQSSRPNSIARGGTDAATVEQAIERLGIGSGAVPAFWKAALEVEALGAIATEKVTISAREIALVKFDRDGESLSLDYSDVKLFRSVSVEALKSLVGSVGGWADTPASETLYRVFLVGQSDGTIGAIVSEFTTADFTADLPLSSQLANGYEYIREVACVYHNASSQLVSFFQFDDLVSFEQDRTVYQNQTLTNSFVEYALPPAIPPGCNVLLLMPGATDGTTIDVAQEWAPSTNGKFPVQFSDQNNGFAAADGENAVNQGDIVLFPIRGAQSIAARGPKASGTTASQSLFIHGFKRFV